MLHHYVLSLYHSNKTRSRGARHFTQFLFYFHNDHDVLYYRCNKLDQMKIEWFIHKVNDECRRECKP